MEITPRKYFVVLRVCLAVLFAFCEFLFSFVVVGIAQGHGTSLLTWLLALAIQIGLLCFFLWLLCCWPWVGFTKEKIQVQILWKIKEYRWEVIPQIGIMDWHMDGRNIPNLVILLPGSVPRKPYDIFFGIKNIGRLIRVPNTPTVRDYIAECYGPLDFDAFDGKTED